MTQPTMPSQDDVRSRVAAGMNVRPIALARFAGLSVTALRLAIERGDIEVVRIGRNVLVPHYEAAKLLGIKPEHAAA